MLQSGFLATGLAVAGWLEYGLAYAEGSVVWRLPLAFPAFLCLISMTFAPFWPESVSHIFSLVPFVRLQS